MTAVESVQTPEIPGYRDVTLISTGSSSLVFRAVQSRLSRTVAIKVLLVDGGASTHAQYQRELETTVLLSSQPHIVGIIDTGTTAAGQPYIVMEYCPGGSYAQILKQRGPLPVDEVVELGAKIAEALQAAHDVGVLHRDVKPSNILRSAFGPALADFGIARAAHQLFGTDSLDRMTPYHASPEAMLKQNQSPASDVYSLASTMWHLLAGRPPFGDPARPPRDLDELRQRVLHEPAPPVPRPDVPQWLQRELARALAKEPGQRHPSAHTLGEILRYQAFRVREEPPVPADPGPVPPQAAPPQAMSPQGMPPQGMPAQGMPPMPAPPVTSGPAAPRDAFRWPAAAPTRRTGRMREPAPEPMTPEALEAAASSTITSSGSTGTGDPFVPPPAAGFAGAPATEPPRPQPLVPEPVEPEPAAKDVASGSRAALTGPTEVYPMVDSRAPVAAPPPAPPPPAPPTFPPPAFPAPPAPPGSPLAGPPRGAPPVAAPRPSDPPFAAQSFPPRPVASAPVQPPLGNLAIDLGTLGTLDARDALEPDRRRRGGTVLAVLAASVALLLVAAVVIVALNHKPATQQQNVADPHPSTTQTVKITTDGAPANVRLQDKQTSITLTWSDPSGGVAPIAVLGAKANDQPQFLKQLDPGTTTWTQEGVNDSYDHCYIVAAFYRTNGSDVAARSPLVCTHRN